MTWVSERKRHIITSHGAFSTPSILQNNRITYNKKDIESIKTYLSKNSNKLLNEASYNEFSNILSAISNLLLHPSIMNAIEIRTLNISYAYDLTETENSKKDIVMALTKYISFIHLLNRLFPLYVPMYLVNVDDDIHTLVDLYDLKIVPFQDSKLFMTAKYDDKSRYATIRLNVNDVIDYKPMAGAYILNGVTFIYLYYIIRAYYNNKISRNEIFHLFQYDLKPRINNALNEYARGKENPFRPENVKKVINIPVGAYGIRAIEIHKTRKSVYADFVIDRKVAERYNKIIENPLEGKAKL